jgi:hypothetical protein
LHSTKWNNGKKKGWKPFSSKNNSLQDSVRNEENRYTVPGCNKIMINNTKAPSDAHRKKPSKRKSWKKSLRNSWKRY